jgi:hypothetical protein
MSKIAIEKSNILSLDNVIISFCVISHKLNINTVMPPSVMFFIHIWILFKMTIFSIKSLSQPPNFSFHFYDWSKQQPLRQQAIKLASIHPLPIDAFRFAPSFLTHFRSF